MTKGHFWRYWNTRIPLIDLNHGFNEPGFGHLAFQVKNIDATIAKVIKAGGKPQGEIADFGTLSSPLLITYVRDPEGNILELEMFDPGI